MQKLLDVIADQWIYDIEVLSQPWVYCGVIPAIFYFVFMLLKWTALMLPLWLTLGAAVSFRSK